MYALSSIILGKKDVFVKIIYTLEKFFKKSNLQFEESNKKQQTSLSGIKFASFKLKTKSRRKRLNTPETIQ
ncbi:MAG: hypothetical protein ACE5WD_02055 [Candidatus Aminicenantia bacterium]